MIRKEAQYVKPTMLPLNALIILSLILPFGAHTVSAASPGVSPTSYNISLAPEAQNTFNLTVQTGPTPVGSVDVVFVVDLTGSMGDDIAALKSAASQILDGIRSKVSNSQFGVTSFKDYPAFYSYPGYSAQYGDTSCGDVAWRLDQNITADLTTVRNAIDSLTLGCGGDGPEDYTRALYETISLHWRPLTKKIVILFGDAPTHDLNFAGYNFGGDPGRDGIARNADDLDFETVVNQLASVEHITVLAVQGSGGGAAAEATFRGMSSGYAGLGGTRGQYFLLSNAGQIPSAIDAMIKAETSQIDRLIVDPFPQDFRSWISTSPTEFQNVGPDQVKSFEVTIAVPRSTAPGEYTFLLRTLGDGALLGSTSVTILVPSSGTRTGLGFSPSADGFKFQNFNTSASWEMFQQFYGAASVMHSNGDRVFAAEDYFNHAYSSAGEGGSCFGFSAASLLNFKHLSQPNAGSFALPYASPLYGQDLSDARRGALGYYQAAQLSYEIQAYMYADSSAAENSPSYFFNKIKQAIQNDDPVILNLWHWNDAKKGFDGGHALAPYRFEESGGVGRVWVYDSNHPGDTGRSVQFDLVSDTWQYQFDEWWIFPTETWSGSAVRPSVAVIPLSMTLHNGLPSWTRGSDRTTYAQIGVSGDASISVSSSGARQIVPVLGATSTLGFDSYLVPGSNYVGTVTTTGTGGSSLHIYGDQWLAKVDLGGVSGIGASFAASSGGSQVGFDGASLRGLTLDQELPGSSRIVGVSGLSGGKGILKALGDGSFAFTNLGPATSFDLDLEVRGAGKGEFRRQMVFIDSGDTDIVKPADWSQLAVTKVTIQVDKGSDGTIDATSTLARVDTSAPTTTIAQNGIAGANDWFTSSVSVALTATDEIGGSGVKEIAYSAFGAQPILATTVGGASTSVNITAEGQTTITYFARDNAGSTEAVKKLTVKIDKVAPAITVSVPIDKVYLVNQSIASSYSCTDGSSGVATCAGPVPNGSSFETASVGVKKFAVNATDLAGNASGQSVAYTVSYGVCPQFDQARVHNSGSTIPIKFQLCDAGGKNVSAASVVVHADSFTLKAGGPVLTPEDAGNSNPANNFRYDEGGYIYNLKTAKTLAPGTYVLRFTVGSDPASHTVEFRVR